MQSHKIRVVMQQAVKRSADISTMSIYKLSENMTIKVNSVKDNMLKDDQDNIRARESTHQVKIYIMMSIYV